VSKEDFMTDNAVVYAAVYKDHDTALADLDALGKMYEEDKLGTYDASVIDKEGGTPHIVRRVDRPTAGAVSEAFGSAVPSETDLERAADPLMGSEAGMIVVGEPEINEQEWDAAVNRASRIVKRDFNTRTDRVANELKQAFSQ
jgi:hypothetical protein